MEILLILVYASLCYTTFRVFRVPLNKWTGTAAVLVGFFGIGILLLLMNYNHPFTRQARFYFNTTPIMPAVQGVVVEVPVRPNAPLHKGEVLFRVDPVRYQQAVARLRASLASAEQTARELEASATGARAEYDKAVATRDRAHEDYERHAQANIDAQRSRHPAPFTEALVEDERQAYLAANAAVESARAALQRAELAASSRIDGVDTTVAALRAQLASAEHELAETVVKAPTDGYVTQLFLRPGMMAVPLPLRPVMVFVHADEKRFAGAFVQNTLQRVRPGDEAEIAFTALPGRIVKGRVAFILDAMAEGQLQPTGALIDPAERPAPGRIVVAFDIDEDLSAYRLPGGASGQVAVYTDHWRSVALLRRILLRMRSWLNYVFLGSL